MTIEIKMPACGPAAAIALNRCEGSLSSEGWHRDCYEECVAHFDAWATGESEYGESSMAYSPYPNALIAGTGLLPAAAQLERWEDEQVYGRNRVSQSAVLLWVPGLFRDGAGDDRDGWVVLRTDDARGEFSAHLTPTEEAGRSLYAAAVSELRGEDEDGDD
jgi:hypothetical protein